jgi:hypothetical protein
MKAKDLAGYLLQYPDYEVSANFGIEGNPYDYKQAPIEMRNIIVFEGLKEIEIGGLV